MSRTELTRRRMRGAALYVVTVAGGLLALGGMGQLIAAQADAVPPLPPPDPPSLEQRLRAQLSLERDRADQLRAHLAAERAHVRTLRARLADRDAYHLEARRYRSAFLCIASHEAGPEHGGWRANTGNGYYGGLQMDRTFQRTYGPELYRRKGTADRWTPDEQIAVASRAVASRGFHPWPNTARTCGLL